MISGYQAYCIFQAVRLHFKQESFDFFKYHGQSKTSVEAFDVRADKFSFVKLGRQYKTEKDLIYAMVVAFATKPDVWVRDVNGPETVSNLREWQAEQNRREEWFAADLKNIGSIKDKVSLKEDSLYPELLTLYFQQDICRDTLVILDFFLDLTPGWNKRMDNELTWTTFYKQFRKYKPFFHSYMVFDTQRFRQMLKDHIKAVDDDQKITKATPDTRICGLPVSIPTPNISLKEGNHEQK